jgi:histidinol-phosphate aminotransferase
LYATLAAIQGADCQQLPFRPDWTLPEGFEQNDARVRLVILANPNSPSGTLVSAEGLLKVARSVTCPLLIDEAYVDFADRHCLSLVHDVDNILVTRSLSKSYSLAGLRFGYVVAPPALIAEMTKVKDSYNCSALAIAGATAAIDDQDWLRDTRQKILTTRERLTAQLRSIGFEVTPSQANFVWCTRRDRPVLPLFQALRQQHVLVRYMNYDGWGDGLRISIGTDDQADACVAALSIALAAD